LNLVQSLWGTFCILAFQSDSDLIESRFESVTSPATFPQSDRIGRNHKKATRGACGVFRAFLKAVTMLFAGLAKKKKSDEAFQRSGLPTIPAEDPHIETH
jgi:hypothetical protein